MDCLSYTILNHLPEQWVRLLYTLIQKCWESGLIPTSWKRSIVILILKHGKARTAASNYRPIALTSHVSKLMERIILNRLTILVHFCEKHNIIPVNQDGFRKSRSTIDHLTKLTIRIKRQVAKRKSVLATFFDVKKAYDQVWHTRLLFKL